ncbi:MAG: NfeD family protein [Deltaproteobacteria bacterium]|nr:NfeD family protein [Deltaproteobacteria bacterium]
MSDWIWIAVICLAAYEVIEHLVFPLIFALVNRKKPSPSGPQGMVGKTCVVKEWGADSGKVLFNSELWNAVGEEPLSPNRKAVIRRVEGLTLVVEPLDERV